MQFAKESPHDAGAKNQPARVVESALIVLDCY
jgi:hypothetical protein